VPPLTGRTLVYDALNLALLELVGRNPVNSKVLMVVGEGNNAAVRPNIRRSRSHAKAAEVQCFALLVAGHNLIGGRVRHFGLDLYDLGSATKGKA
jgi:hypothetical protein